MSAEYWKWPVICNWPVESADSEVILLLQLSSVSLHCWLDVVNDMQFAKIHMTAFLSS